MKEKAMSPLLRDLYDIMPSLKGTQGTNELLKDALKVLHPYGVVIGGVYRHFKGNEYRVIGISLDSEDVSKVYVVYKNKNEEIYHREISNFLESLDSAYKGPRFKLVRI